MGVPISIRLDDDVRSELEAQARARGVGLATLLRDLATEAAREGRRAPRSGRMSPRRPRDGRRQIALAVGVEGQVADSASPGGSGIRSWRGDNVRRCGVPP
jgi:hypothetical protein